MEALLDGFDHVFDDFLRVTEDHHGFVEVEQFVIQTGIAAGHRALVDDDGLGFERFENRHAGLDNELFYLDKTMMVFGDAKKVIEDMVKAVE